MPPRNLNIGDIIKIDGEKGFWKVLSECRYHDESLISHWKLEMFYTDNFREPLKRVTGKLWDIKFSTIITLDWIHKQIEDAHDNYNGLWAAIEDDEYANRNK